MGTPYQRQDVSNNIANGNVINADDLDNEFNALEGAFVATTGHSHDGTAGEGGPITVVGPAQDITVSGTQVLPKTTNTVDLGSSSLKFKDAYIDGTLFVDALNYNGTALLPTAAELNFVDGVTSNIQTQIDSKQTIDPELTALAGLVSAADRLPYFTGAGTAALATFTSFGRSLVDDTDAAAARTTLGLGTMSTQNSGAVTITGGSVSGITDLAVADGGTGVSTITGIIRGNGTSPFTAAVAGTDFLAPAAIGTTVQAYDAGLQSISGLTTAADRMIYTTGSDVYAVTPLTSFARTVLDDVDAASVRSTLGLGGLSTLSSVTTSQVDPATLVTAAEGINANNTDTTLPTSAAVKSYVDARTPVQIRAAVNFSGVALTGTYSRTGTLVTVTMTAHGMTTGQAALFTVQSGAAANNHTAIVTVIDANTFTYTDAASGTTSGNLTRRVWLRGWFNVNRVIYNGVGDYTVEFTTALPTENYVLNATLSGGSFVISVTALTTTTARVQVQNSATGAAAENGLVSIMAVI